MGKSLSKLIILNKQGIQLRRQYLTDIRFKDTQSNELGAKATHIEFDDFIHYENKFIEYIMQFRYPFTNDLYLVRTDVKIPLNCQNNSGNHSKIIPMDNELRFRHFLQFINKEFNVDLMQNENRSLRMRDKMHSDYEETKSEFNKVHDQYSKSQKPYYYVQDNLMNTLNESFNSTSHHRTQTVLNQYQASYQREQNPHPTVGAPNHETHKNQMFIWKRFFE